MQAKAATRSSAQPSPARTGAGATSTKSRSRSQRSKAATECRLLLVAFDDLGVAKSRRAWVATRFPQRPALAEQIPRLVEPDLHQFQPAVLGLAQTTFRAALVELVFLGHQRLDAFMDPLVFHHAAV